MQIFLAKNDADVFYNTKRGAFWTSFCVIFHSVASSARCVSCVGSVKMCVSIRLYVRAWYFENAPGQKVSFFFFSLAEIAERAEG